MKKSTQLKTMTAAAVICLLLLPDLSGLKAQEAEPQPQSSTELQIPGRGTRIWTGTAGLNWQSFYRYSNDPDGIWRLDRRSQTILEMQFRNLRFVSPSVSVGAQGLGQFFMENAFGNLGLGGGGLGPVVRYYPFVRTVSPRWQPYLQADALAGYDLALGDSVGAIRGEGFRLRTGLRGGLAYRLSNALGIYLEAGRDWERSEEMEIDARAWQMEFGIQLFRFK